MASLQIDRKKRVSGKFCVAGGPGNISCNNTSLTKDISMHTFPSDDILKRKWTQFVQKHRPGFKPSQTSVLCSVHFDKHCFTRRLDLLDPENVSVEISKSTRLVKGSVPTIDTARQIKKQADTQDLLTVRDKRMIVRKHSRKVRRFFRCICLFIPVINQFELRSVSYFLTDLYQAFYSSN
jgi:hypothetical protein